MYDILSNFELKIRGKFKQHVSLEGFLELLVKKCISATREILIDGKFFRFNCQLSYFYDMIASLSDNSLHAAPHVFDLDLVIHNGKKIMEILAFF